MYYRGQNFEYSNTRLSSPRGKYICYAESADGIDWEKPELGLVEFDGSRKNNIVMDGGNILNGMFSPFKDGNPACAADARYKSFVLMQRGDARGLWAYSSPDGLHWSEMSDGPVITRGLLDTQNLAFWDGERGEYRAYHRNEFRLPQTGEEPYSSHPVQASSGVQRVEAHKPSDADRQQDGGWGQLARVSLRARHSHCHFVRFCSLDAIGLCQLQRGPTRRALHQSDHALLPGAASLCGLSDAVCRTSVVGVFGGVAGVRASTHARRDQRTLRRRVD